MHVIELFLPVRDCNGDHFEGTKYDRVRRELVERFGGVTIYARAPAEGEWVGGEGENEEDDLVVFEIMTAELDGPWWTAYRKGLELAFHQDSILCRASRVDVL